MWRLIYRSSSGNRVEFYEHTTHIYTAIPDVILEEAGKLGIKRLKLVIPEDLNIVKVGLSDDLDLEQTHDVVMWEAASMFGVDGDSSRTAYVNSSLLDVGGNDGAILTSHFSKNNIDVYIAQCKKCGILFDGISSLQLLVSYLHSMDDNSHAESLLMIRKNLTFGLVPGREGRELSTRNIPVGLPPEGSETGRMDNQIFPTFICDDRGGASSIFHCFSKQ